MGHAVTIVDVIEDIKETSVNAGLKNQTQLEEINEIFLKLGHKTEIYFG